MLGSVIVWDTQMTEWLERVRGELAGRYRIECELGRGSTATVYFADDLARKRHARSAYEHLQPSTWRAFVSSLRREEKLSEQHVRPAAAQRSDTVIP